MTKFKVNDKVEICTDSTSLAAINMANAMMGFSWELKNGVIATVVECTDNVCEIKTENGASYLICMEDIKLVENNDKGTELKSLYDQLNDLQKQIDKLTKPVETVKTHKIGLYRNGNLFGVVGDKTKIKDSNGKTLHIGDIVKLSINGIEYVSVITYDKTLDKAFVMGACMLFNRDGSYDAMGRLFDVKITLLYDYDKLKDHINEVEESESYKLEELDD